MLVRKIVAASSLDNHTTIQLSQAAQLLPERLLNLYVKGTARHGRNRVWTLVGAGTFLLEGVCQTMKEINALLDFGYSLVHFWSRMRRLCDGFQFGAP